MCICYSSIQLSFNMSENNEAMECETTKNDNIDEFSLEPGYSGTEPNDYPRSNDNSKLYDNSGPSDDLEQDYYPETNELESKEESEPLFVIDRTRNFKLNRPIEYEVIIIFKLFNIYKIVSSFH